MNSSCPALLPVYDLYNCIFQDFHSSGSDIETFKYMNPHKQTCTTVCNLLTREMRNYFLRVPHSRKLQIAARQKSCSTSEVRSCFPVIAYQCCCLCDAIEVVLPHDTKVCYKKHSQEGGKSSSLPHFAAVWFIRKQVSFLTFLFSYSRRLLNTGASLLLLLHAWKHRRKNSSRKGRVGLRLPLFGISIATNPYRRQQYSAATLESKQHNEGRASRADEATEQISSPSFALAKL